MANVGFLINALVLYIIGLNVYVFLQEIENHLLIVIVFQDRGTIVYVEMEYPDFFVVVKGFIVKIHR